MFKIVKNNLKISNTDQDHVFFSVLAANDLIRRCINLSFVGRLAISYILTVCTISNDIIKAALTADGESISNMCIITLTFDLMWSRVTQS